MTTIQTMKNMAIASKAFFEPLLYSNDEAEVEEAKSFLNLFADIEKSFLEYEEQLKQRDEEIERLKTEILQGTRARFKRDAFGSIEIT